MLRAVFHTNSQGFGASFSLKAACADVNMGKTMKNAARNFWLSYGPTSSMSTLPFWSRQSISTVSKTSSRSYSQVADHTNKTFLPKEGAILVKKIKILCQINELAEKNSNILDGLQLSRRALNGDGSERCTNATKSS